MGVVLVFILFIAIPVILGSFFLRLDIATKDTNDKSSILKSMLKTKQIFEFEDEPTLGIAWVLGLFSIFGIYQVAYIPFIFTTQEFMPTYYVWMALMLTLTVISLFKNYYYIYKMVIHFIVRIRKTPIVTIVALLFIGFQIYYTATYAHIDWDDLYYFPLATEALESNTMFVYDPRSGIYASSLNTRYAFSGYNICVAAISLFVDLHPMIIFCTIFPVIFVSAAYIVYAMISDRLFSGDREKTGYFLLFLAVINLFGYYSEHYSVSAFLLQRVWQGKGLLAVVIIPLLFWYMIRISKKEERLSDWVAIFCINFYACALSSMAVYLTLVFLWSFALVFSIIQKSKRLIVPTIICTVINFIIFAVYLIY